MGHIILVHRMENIQNIWRKSITNNIYTTHATHTTHATLLQSCYRLITHSEWLKYDPWWPRMIEYGKGWHNRGQRGSRGVRGGVRGHQGVLGATRLLPTPKWVIKQQNNGSKPWFKVPKVCSDPKGMVFIHFWGIWGHLDALQQRYLVKTPICGYQQFLDISLCLFQPTKLLNFWMVS